MIKSKYNPSSFILEGEVAIITYTVIIFILALAKNGLYEVSWLICACAVLFGLVVEFRQLRPKFCIETERHSHSSLLLRPFCLLLSLLSLGYALYPEFSEKNTLNLALVLGVPVIGFPVYYIVGKTKKHIAQFTINRKQTLIAGVGELAANVERKLCNRYVKGFINCRKEKCQVDHAKVIGEIDCIHEYLENNPVDEIVIALPFKHIKKIRNIVLAADHFGVRVKYIPDYESLFGKHYKTRRFGQIEAVEVRQFPLDNRYAAFVKNCFDKVFSALALCLLLPLFLILALFIKLESPGPVCYCPIRVGRAGKPFKVFKFRSMRVNDASSGGVLSTKLGDPRITRLGQVMRKYSIDELPQFLNVLMGHMSVVGPRPHRTYLNQQFQQSEQNYMLRHYYKPGITGWAQVNGWRGPTETKEQKSQRTLHDLWYIENWSMLLDLKIIFMTIFSSKARKNSF